MAMDQWLVSGYRKSTLKESRTMAKSKRGFASMKPERVREIAVMGGNAVHEQKAGRQWTKKEARAHGRAGGLASAASRKKAREEARGNHQA